MKRKVKQMKKGFAFSLALCMALSLSACGGNPAGSPVTSSPAASAPPASASSASNTSEPTSSLDYVAVGAGATGGAFFMTTSTFCQTYNEKRSGTTCNAETTSGSVENNKMIIDGELQMAISNIDIAYCAASGTREFADGEYSKGGDLCVLLPGGWNNVMNIIVRADSGITEISQLAGKKIACNSGTQLTDYTPMLMKAYGIEDYELTAVTTSEMADAMRDKLVDAIIQFGQAPVSAFSDLASTTDVLWLSIDEEHMSWITENYPYFAPSKIPAGTYEGQTEEISVLGNMPCIVARTDLDEGFVYQFVKCMMENHEEMVVSYAACSQYTLESLVNYYNDNSNILPLHSGAVKYLQSINAI